MPVSNFSIAALMGHAQDNGLREDNRDHAEEDNSNRFPASDKGKSQFLEKNTVLTSEANEVAKKQKESRESNDPALQRKRTSFSRLQQRMLEAKFQRTPYLTIQERNSLATFLQLNSRQVKVWFQNRRNKWKRENKGQFLIQPALEMKSYGSFNPALENCFTCPVYKPYTHIYFGSAANQR